MDKNPRELPDPSATPKPVFANEVTQQDKKEMNEFFTNSSTL